MQAGSSGQGSSSSGAPSASRSGGNGGHGSGSGGSSAPGQRSQASPAPSASASSCAASRASGHTSYASGTPSASASGGSASTSHASPAPSASTSLWPGSATSGHTSAPSGMPSPSASAAPAMSNECNAATASRSKPPSPSRPTRRAPAWMRTQRAAPSPTVARSKASPPAPAGGTNCATGIPTRLSIGTDDGTTALAASRANTGYTPAQPGWKGASSSAQGNVRKVIPSALTDTRAGSANGGSVAMPRCRNAFSKTRRSGPGPSSARLSPRSSVMRPRRPSESVSVPPWNAPPPRGGPRT